MNETVQHGVNLCSYHMLTRQNFDIIWSTGSRIVRDDLGVPFLVVAYRRFDCSRKIKAQYEMSLVILWRDLLVRARNVLKPAILTTQRLPTNRFNH